MSKPIVTLQENATRFFDKVLSEYSDSMTCKEKCSKCCFVDLSVFSVEANRIEEWFDAQAEAIQMRLRQEWKSAIPVGENAKGEKGSACVFLKDDSCTIYEARPLICRTQGAPLFFETENMIDVCPLNFKEQELPPKASWLNVDRMNALLSFAQGEEGERVSLKDLQRKLMIGVK